MNCRPLGLIPLAPPVLTLMRPASLRINPDHDPVLVQPPRWTKGASLRLAGWDDAAACFSQRSPRRTAPSAPAPSNKARPSSCPWLPEAKRRSTNPVSERVPPLPRPVTAPVGDRAIDLKQALPGRSCGESGQRCAIEAAGEDLRFLGFHRLWQNNPTMKMLRGLLPLSSARCRSVPPSPWTRGDTHQPGAGWYMSARPFSPV